MESPAISLAGAPNFRDLGGYRTSDGRTVRRSMLFRSGHLAHLTDDDLERLDDIGVTTVVDFRAGREIEIFGRDRLVDGAVYVSIPVTDQDPGAVHAAIHAGDFTGLHDLAGANRRMIRDNTDEFTELLRLIAVPHNLPLIFHCIGGKDRTGVASALILSILGVPWESVRIDYLRSNDMMQGIAEEQIAQLSGGRLSVGEPTEENLAALRRFFIVEGSYIDAARDEIDRAAGDFDRYVAESLGLSPDEVEAIRRNLLEEPVADSATAG